MKDTLKILSLLEENIERLIENGIYEIERDLLLERLRGLYASVVATEAVAEEDRVLDALLGIGAVLPEEESEPEIEIERIYAEEDEDDVAAESEAEEEFAAPEEEVADQEEVSEEDESVVEEEPAVVAVENDDIDHEAVLSLYDDDDEEEVESQEEVVAEAENEEQDADCILLITEEGDEEGVVVLEEDESEAEEVPEEESQKVVLGDVLLSEQTTVADNLAEQMTMDVATAASSVASLRESIGVNDKYILLRDLFANNNEYYEQSIEQLDSFDSLDEAMLYIYDNFQWNPNCEGARLLMELMARKLF